VSRPIAVPTADRQQHLQHGLAPKPISTISSAAGGTAADQIFSWTRPDGHHQQQAEQHEHADASLPSRLPPADQVQREYRGGDPGRGAGGQVDLAQQAERTPGPSR